MLFSYPMVNALNPALLLRYYRIPDFIQVDCFSTALNSKGTALIYWLCTSLRNYAKGIFRMFFRRMNTRWVTRQVTRFRPIVNDSNDPTSAQGLFP